MENAVFDNQLVTELIKTGDSKFMWIGVGLVIFQVVLIPIMAFVFKFFCNHSKKLTDVERQVTKLERDAQIASLEKKIDEHILEDKSKQVSNNYLMEGLAKGIEELGNKVNKMVDELKDISIYIGVQKSKE
jgi:hypothetical protein